MVRITGGELRGRRLAAAGKETRPTTEKVRQALFNTIQHKVMGAHVLDLFAGSGAVAIEAISRGAASAICVESSRRAAQQIRRSLETLDIESVCEVVCGDVFRSLARLAGPFTIIFADPPYGKGYGERLLTALDELDLLADGGLCILEEVSYKRPPLRYLELIEEREYGDTHLYIFKK